MFLHLTAWFVGSVCFCLLETGAKKIRCTIAVGKAHCCFLEVFFAKVKRFWDVKTAKTGTLVVVPNANKMCR